MDNQGWIKLHRKLLNWQWSDSPNTGWLFMICLMSANHENKMWHGVLIEKGTFITSYPHLAKKVGLSEQSVRTSLNKLKSTGELTVKTTNKYSVITINNWITYQSTNRQPNTRLTDNQQTTNRQLTANKNDKNDKNVIKTSKNSLTSCTEEELKEISLLLDVSLDAVKRTHEIIVNKIASKEFKNKTVYHSLKNWIIMGIERGTIRINPASGYKLMKTV
jgi:biotin operon repressor